MSCSIEYRSSLPDLPILGLAITDSLIQKLKSSKFSVNKNVIDKYFKNFMDTLLDTDGISRVEIKIVQKPGLGLNQPCTRP